MDLSPKQTEAWLALEDNSTNEILYGGAAGGGKSVLGCVWHIWRRTKYPGSRGLIARAVIKDIEESTLVTFYEVCARLGYKAGEHYDYNSVKHVIRWANGSTTLLKELKDNPADPDFNRLGSTEYTDAFIDEAIQVSSKAFDIVNSRIRYKLHQYGLVPKILLTSNPGDGWLKEKFIMNSYGEPVALKPYEKFFLALLSDNPDENFKASYFKQLDKMGSDYDRRRLLYGDWEAIREVLNPFASHYIPGRHESSTAVFQKDKQLVITVDFNLNPFAVTFSHIWKDDKYHCHTFDEAAIHNGSIPAMCELIKGRYEAQLITCKLTGDAMGSKRDISQRDNSSYYNQMMRLLNLRNSQLVIPDSNPTHVNSRADVNYVLEYFDDFKINPDKCPETCRDMRTVQCDAFGSIVKRNRKDLSQRADFLDAQRYLVNSFLWEWLTRHRKRK